MTPSRRRFIRIVPLAGTAWLVAASARAAAPLVDEADAQAKTLGYVHDAAKADKARFKQYAAGQRCGTCGLYKGAAGAAAGACPIFPGKEVKAAGWSSAYAKKA